MLIQSQHNGHYLTFDDVEHSYTLDGKLIPGVTTSNKQGYPASPHLMTWMIKQGAWYTIERLKECPEQVSRLPNYLLDEIAKKSTTASKKKAKEAADIGSIVHDYTEAWVGLNHHKTSVLDLSIQAHPEEKTINLCLREMKKWHAESSYEEVDAEQIIASVEYQYAGKYDSLVKKGSKIILVDYKTSNGIYAEHKIQVGGAYRRALREWRDLDIDGIDLVRFGKDGSFDHHLITRKSQLDELEDQFIRNLKTAEFRKEWE
jgi:hypothetical protein